MKERLSLYEIQHRLRAAQQRLEQRLTSRQRANAEQKVREYFTRSMREMNRIQRLCESGD